MASSPPTLSQALTERNVERHKISELLLDPSNPRFGGLGGTTNQSKIAEFVVQEFGVEDVLASLATNGYFHSEPLVAKRSDLGLVVVEGNRRLAACLILANDPRAESLAHLRPKRLSQEWNGETYLPVLVFEESEQASLLPYLGVRHIVGSQPWDSFAKARWIDMVVSNGQMTLSEIESAIGDTNRTITRMLDGYRFIQQLIETGNFKPTESHRRGKGSNVHFPFSWVYTLLDYSQVREYLELPPRNEARHRPIPAKTLSAATRAVGYMFGSGAKAPSIQNSRQIPDLADALADPIKRELLEEGHFIDYVIQHSRPASDRLATLIRESGESLKAATGVVSEGMLSQKDAESFVSPTNAVRNLANALFKGIQSVAFPGDDDGK